jgi:hypothetical protein
VVPESPVLAAGTVAARLGISELAARPGLCRAALGGVDGIAGPVGRGRPGRWWEAQGLLALLGREQPGA